MRPMFPQVPGLDELIRHADRLQLRTVSRWLGLSLVLGMAAGAAAIVFYVATDWVRHLVIHSWAGHNLAEPDGERTLFAAIQGQHFRPWALVLAPTLGGLLVGLLSHLGSRFGAGHERNGTDGLIHAFHNSAVIPARLAMLKSLSAVVLLGSGGSAGREGPIAYLSGALGQVLGLRLRLSEREVRLMLLAGAAGGIGAIFRTPLGAALFVIEVLYRDDTEVEGFVPAVMSSVAAYSTFTAFLRQERIFTVPAYDFEPGQLPLYVVMAVGCAVSGLAFIKVFHAGLERWLPRLPGPSWLRPGFGGLGVGLLALVTPLSLGAGYGFLQRIIRDDASALPPGTEGAAFLIGIAALKIVTTTLSVGSSREAGVFGPSVVIGGLTGAAFGQLFHAFFPGLVPHIGPFVVVGMACFVGGVAHAPVSTLVMATEMTGSYELLVPLMLAEAVTFVVLQPWTLFRQQVPSRRESGAHWAEHMFDLLHDHHVSETPHKQAFIETVGAATPLQEVLRTLSSSSQTVLPVLDSAGKPQGMVTLEALRSFMFEDNLGALALAYDCQQPLVTLMPSDTLSTALDRFIASRSSQLPVVSDEHPDQVVGLLAYEDLMRIYDQARTRAAF